MPENRFLALDTPVRHTTRRNGRAPAFAAMESWASPFAATDRSLVILIDNGGVDLGIPQLVDKLLAVIPGSSMIPDSVRSSFVKVIRDTLRNVTDNLLETAELTLNRYSAAKPDLFGDVYVLRDGTASYAELKSRLISLSQAGKIIDLFILTHGGEHSIAVDGGIDSDKIVAMKTEHGKPLTIRCVYQMNCWGLNLTKAWLDAGAKAVSGTVGINYFPEPSTFFFWDNWKSGQTFENAITGAYRKTIKLMNDAISGFTAALPIPAFDIEMFAFVQQSAPKVLGQRTVTITTDELSFTQTKPSSLATTVLPLSVLEALSDTTSDAARTPMALSPGGVALIKQFEGFRAQMYNDPVGHCTVGYGTLLHKGKCDGRAEEQPYAGGVTETQATQLLEQEAGEFQRVVNETVKVPVNQNQNDALVSFVYNVGPGAFKSSTLLKKLNQKDYAAVPAELKKWTKARENGKLVELPGLVARRRAEAELFEHAADAQPSATQSFAAWEVPPTPRYIVALGGSSPQVDVDGGPILDYIRSEAATRAARAVSVDTSSRFYKRLTGHYLKAYLASPSASTGQAAIDAIGKAFPGPATAGDRWEDGAIKFWNKQPIPAAFRRMRPDLPAELAAATDILSRPNRAELPYIDVPFLLGAPNTGLGFDDDWTLGGKNISQLMHWGTGVKYSHLAAETMRELFLGYEMWHLEGFDVFGEDSLNDLISEEQGRILGTHLRAATITTANLQSSLNECFREARAWVGALIRARKKDLEDWILADSPRPAKIWWKRDVQIWGTETIKSMLRAGQSPDAIKKSTLVLRIIDIYALMLEADAWERAKGPIPLSEMSKKLLAHEYDSVLSSMAGGEGGSMVLS